jgi:hypothetical protein
LKLSDEPLTSSILILQPEDLRKLYGRFDNDFYGHVAWVTGIENREDGTYIDVLESYVYPPAGGSHWHGCWWREHEYSLEKLGKLKFLYISCIKTSAFELSLNIGDERIEIIVKPK